MISSSYLVASDVQYTTVWSDGKPTSQRNGDRFFYVTEDVASQLPDKMEFSEYTAWIFKLVTLMKCMHCGESGHKKNDDA